MEVLTVTEGELLNMTRRILLDIAKRVERETTNDDWDNRRIGRIASGLEMAEEAIFTALNNLSAYGDDKVAEEYAVYVGRTVPHEVEN